VAIAVVQCYLSLQQAAYNKFWNNRNLYELGAYGPSDEDVMLAYYELFDNFFFFGPCSPTQHLTL